MKRLMLVMSLLVSLAASAPAFATCSAYGPFCLLGTCYYDHIANGHPDSDTCWTRTADFVSSSSCGYSAYAWEFAYGDTLSQDIVVGATQTGTSWDLAFYLDFNDPNNSAFFNNIQATVFDVTSQTTLGSFTYTGAQPDITCTRKDINFSGNLAGHTLRVSFSARRDAQATIRVRDIALWQN